MNSEKSTSFSLLPLPLVRVVSLTLSVLIFAGDPSTAAGVSDFLRSSYSTDLRDFSLPARLGDVTDRWAPSGQKTASVILVQDLHANAQAQENIARIIEIVFRRLQVRDVFMEAAFGKCDPSILRSVRGAGARQRLTDHLLQKAYLSGDDLAAVRIGRGTLSPLSLEGVDDPLLYLANVQAFRDLVVQGRDAARQWKEVRNFLLPGAAPQLRRHLELTEKLLSLKMLDSEWIQYREHRDLTPRGTGALASAIAAGERFYTAAEARNGAMASNLLGRLGGSKKSVVLVTGGFHTATIAHELKTRGIAFAVVAPMVDRLDQEDLYVKTLTEPPHETVRALNPLMFGKVRQLQTLASQLKLPIGAWIASWPKMLVEARRKVEQGPVDPASGKSLLQRLAERWGQSGRVTASALRRATVSAALVVSGLFVPIANLEGASSRRRAVAHAAEIASAPHWIEIGAMAFGIVALIAVILRGIFGHSNSKPEDSAYVSTGRKTRSLNNGAKLRIAIGKGLVVLEAIPDRFHGLLDALHERLDGFRARRAARKERKAQEKAEVGEAEATVRKDAPAAPSIRTLMTSRRGPKHWWAWLNRYTRAAQVAKRTEKALSEHLQQPFATAEQAKQAKRAGLRDIELARGEAGARPELFQALFKELDDADVVFENGSYWLVPKERVNIVEAIENVKGERGPPESSLKWAYSQLRLATVAGVIAIGVGACSFFFSPFSGFSFNNPFIFAVWNVGSGLLVLTGLWITLHGFFSSRSDLRPTRRPAVRLGAALVLIFGIALGVGLVQGPKAPPPLQQSPVVLTQTVTRDSLVAIPGVQLPKYKTAEENADSADAAAARAEEAAERAAAQLARAQATLARQQEVLNDTLPVRVTSNMLTESIQSLAALDPAQVARALDRVASDSAQPLQSVRDRIEGLRTIAHQLADLQQQIQEIDGQLKQGKTLDASTLATAQKQIAASILALDNLGEAHANYVSVTGFLRAVLDSTSIAGLDSLGTSIEAALPGFNDKLARLLGDITNRSSAEGGATLRDFARERLSREVARTAKQMDTSAVSLDSADRAYLVSALTKATNDSASVLALHLEAQFKALKSHDGDWSKAVLSSHLAYLSLLTAQNSLQSDSSQTRQEALGEAVEAWKEAGRLASALNPDTNDSLSVAQQALPSDPALLRDVVLSDGSTALDQFEAFRAQLDPTGDLLTDAQALLAWYGFTVGHVSDASQPQVSLLLKTAQELGRQQTGFKTAQVAAREYLTQQLRDSASAPDSAALQKQVAGMEQQAQLVEARAKAARDLIEKGFVRLVQPGSFNPDTAELSAFVSILEAMKPGTVHFKSPKGAEAKAFDQSVQNLRYVAMKMQQTVQAGEKVSEEQVQQLRGAFQSALNRFADIMNPQLVDLTDRANTQNVRVVYEYMQETALFGARYFMGLTNNALDQQGASEDERLKMWRDIVSGLNNLDPARIEQFRNTTVRHGGLRAIPEIRSLQDMVALTDLLHVASPIIGAFVTHDLSKDWKAVNHDATWIIQHNSPTTKDGKTTYAPNGDESIIINRPRDYQIALGAANATVNAAGAVSEFILAVRGSVEDVGFIAATLDPKVFGKLTWDDVPSEDFSAGHLYYTLPNGRMLRSQSTIGDEALTDSSRWALDNHGANGSAVVNPKGRFVVVNSAGQRYFWIAGTDRLSVTERMKHLAQAGIASVYAYDFGAALANGDFGRRQTIAKVGTATTAKAALRIFGFIQQSLGLVTEWLPYEIALSRREGGFVDGRALRPVVSVNTTSASGKPVKIFVDKTGTAYRERGDVVEDLNGTVQYVKVKGLHRVLRGIANGIQLRNPFEGVVSRYQPGMATVVATYNNLNSKSGQYSARIPHSADVLLSEEGHTLSVPDAIEPTTYDLGRQTLSVKLNGDSVKALAFYAQTPSGKRGSYLGLIVLNGTEFKRAKDNPKAIDPKSIYYYVGSPSQSIPGYEGMLEASWNPIPAEAGQAAFAEVSGDARWVFDVKRNAEQVKDSTGRVILTRWHDKTNQYFFDARMPGEEKLYWHAVTPGQGESYYIASTPVQGIAQAARLAEDSVAGQWTPALQGASIASKTAAFYGVKGQPNARLFQDSNFDWYLQVLRGPAEIDGKPVYAGTYKWSPGVATLRGLKNSFENDPIYQRIRVPAAIDLAALKSSAKEVRTMSDGSVQTWYDFATGSLRGAFVETTDTDGRTSVDFVQLSAPGLTYVKERLSSFKATFWQPIFVLPSAEKLKWSSVRKPSSVPVDGIAQVASGLSNRYLRIRGADGRLYLFQAAPTLAGQRRIVAAGERADSAATLVPESDFEPGTLPADQPGIRVDGQPQRLIPTAASAAKRAKQISTKKQFANVLDASVKVSDIQAQYPNKPIVRASQTGKTIAMGGVRVTPLSNPGDPNDSPTAHVWSLFEVAQDGVFREDSSATTIPVKKGQLIQLEYGIPGVDAESAVQKSVSPVLRKDPRQTVDMVEESQSLHRGVVNGDRLPASLGAGAAAIQGTWYEAKDANGNWNWTYFSPARRSTYRSAATGEVVTLEPGFIYVYTPTESSGGAYRRFMNEGQRPMPIVTMVGEASVKEAYRKGAAERGITSQLVRSKTAVQIPGTKVTGFALMSTADDPDAPVSYVVERGGMVTDAVMGSVKVSRGQLIVIESPLPYRAKYLKMMSSGAGAIATYFDGDPVPLSTNFSSQDYGGIVRVMDLTPAQRAKLPFAAGEKSLVKLDATGRPVAQIQVTPAGKAYIADRLKSWGYVALAPGRHSIQVVLRDSTGQEVERVNRVLSGWVPIGDGPDELPIEWVRSNAALKNGRDDSQGWDLLSRPSDEASSRPVGTVIYGRESALDALENSGITPLFAGHVADGYVIGTKAKPRHLTQAQIDSLGSRLVAIVRDSSGQMVPAVWNGETLRWHPYLLEVSKRQLVPSPKPFTHVIEETEGQNAWGVVDTLTGKLIEQIEFVRKPAEEVDSYQREAESTLRDSSSAAFRRNMQGPYPSPERLKKVFISRTGVPTVRIRLVDGTSSVRYRNAVTGEVTEDLLRGGQILARTYYVSERGGLNAVRRVTYGRGPDGRFSERVPAEQWENIGGRWVRTGRYTVQFNRSFEYSSEADAPEKGKIFGDLTSLFTADGKSVLGFDFRDEDGKLIWSQRNMNRTVYVYAPAMLPSGADSVPVNEDGLREIATRMYSYELGTINEGQSANRESALLAWNPDNSVLVLESGPKGLKAARQKLTGYPTLTATNAEQWLKDEMERWLADSTWVGGERLTLYGSDGLPVAERGVDAGGMVYTYTVVSGKTLRSYVFDKNPGLEMLDHQKGVRLRTTEDMRNPVRRIQVNPAERLDDSDIADKDPNHMYVRKNVDVQSLTDNRVRVAESVIWYRATDGKVVKIQRREKQQGMDWTAFHVSYPQRADNISFLSRGDELRRFAVGTDSARSEVWFQGRKWMDISKHIYPENTQFESTVFDTRSDQEQPIPLFTTVSRTGSFGYLHLVARDGQDAVYSVDPDGRQSLEAFIAGKKVAVSYGAYSVFPTEALMPRFYSTLPNVMARTGLNIFGVQMLNAVPDPRMGPLIRNGEIIYPDWTLEARSHRFESNPKFPVEFFDRSPWTLDADGVSRVAPSDSVIDALLESRFPETGLITTSPGTRNSDYVETVREATIIEYLARNGQIDRARQILKAYMDLTENGSLPVRSFYAGRTKEAIVYDPEIKANQAAEATSEVQIRLATVALQVARWSGDAELYSFAWQLIARVLEYESESGQGGFARLRPEANRNYGVLGMTYAPRRIFETKANLEALRLLRLAVTAAAESAPTVGVDMDRLTGSLAAQDRWIKNHLVPIVERDRYVPASFEEQRTLTEMNNPNGQSVLQPLSRSTVSAWVTYLDLAPELGVSQALQERAFDDLYRLHAVRLEMSGRGPRMGFDFASPFGRTEGDLINAEETANALRVATKMGYSPAMDWTRHALQTLQDRDGSLPIVGGVTTGAIKDAGVATGEGYSVLERSEETGAPSATIAARNALQSIPEPAVRPIVTQSARAGSTTDAPIAANRRMPDFLRFAWLALLGIPLFFLIYSWISARLFKAERERREGTLTSSSDSKSRSKLVGFFGRMLEKWTSSQSRNLAEKTNDVLVPERTLVLAHRRWAMNVMWRESSDRSEEISPQGVGAAERQLDPRVVLVHGPVEGRFLMSLQAVMGLVMAWREEELRAQNPKWTNDQIAEQLLGDDAWMNGVDELAIVASMYFRREFFLGTASEDQTQIYSRMETFFYENRELLREALGRGKEGRSEVERLLVNLGVQPRSRMGIKGRDEAMLVVESAYNENEPEVYQRYEKLLGIDGDKTARLVAKIREMKRREDFAAPHPYAIELITLLPFFLLTILGLISYESGQGNLLQFVSNAIQPNSVAAYTWPLMGVLTGLFTAGTLFKLRGGIGRIRRGSTDPDGRRLYRFREAMSSGLRWSMILRSVALMGMAFVVGLGFVTASTELWALKMIVSGLLFLEGFGYIYIPWRDLGLTKNKSTFLLMLKYFFRPPLTTGGMAAWVNFILVNAISSIFMAVMGHIAYPWFVVRHTEFASFALVSGFSIFMLSSYLLRYGVHVLLTVLAAFYSFFPRKAIALGVAIGWALLPTYAPVIIGVGALLIGMQTLIKKRVEKRQSERRGSGKKLGTKTVFIYAGGDSLASPALITKMDPKNPTEKHPTEKAQPTVEQLLERWAREAKNDSIGLSIKREKLGIPEGVDELNTVKQYLEALYRSEEYSKVTLFSLRQLYDSAMPKDLRVSVYRDLAGHTPYAVSDIEKGFAIRRWITDMTARGGQSQNTGQNLVEIAEGLMRVGRASEAYFVFIQNRYNNQTAIPSQERLTYDSETGQRVALIKLIEYVTHGQASGKVVYDWTPAPSKSGAMSGIDALWEILPEMDSMAILDRNAVGGEIGGDSDADIAGVIHDFELMRDNPDLQTIIPSRATFNVKQDVGESSRMVEEGHASAVAGTMLLGGSQGEAIGTGWMNFTRTYYWPTVRALADRRTPTVPLTKRLLRKFYFPRNQTLMQRVRAFPRFLRDWSAGHIGFANNASGISEDIMSVQQNAHAGAVMGRTPTFMQGSTIVHKLRESNSHSAFGSAWPRWAGGFMDAENDFIQQYAFTFGPLSLVLKEVRRNNGRFFGSVLFSFTNLAVLPLSIRLGLSPFRGVDLIFWVIGTVFSQVLRLHGLIAMMRNRGFSEVTGVVGAAGALLLFHSIPIALFAYVGMGFITAISDWIPNQIRDMFLFSPQLTIHQFGQWLRSNLKFAVSGGGDPESGRSGEIGKPDPKWNHSLAWISALWAPEFGNTPFERYTAYVKKTWPVETERPWSGYMKIRFVIHGMTVPGLRQTITQRYGSFVDRTWPDSKTRPHSFLMTLRFVSHRISAADQRVAFRAFVSETWPDPADRPSGWRQLQAYLGKDATSRRVSSLSRSLPEIREPDAIGPQVAERKSWLRNVGIVLGRLWTAFERRSPSSIGPWIAVVGVGLTILDIWAILPLDIVNVVMLYFALMFAAGNLVGPFVTTAKQGASLGRYSFLPKVGGALFGLVALFGFGLTVGSHPVAGAVLLMAGLIAGWLPSLLYERYLKVVGDLSAPRAEKWAVFKKALFSRQPVDPKIWDNNFTAMTKVRRFVSEQARATVLTIFALGPLFLVPVSRDIPYTIAGQVAMINGVVALTGILTGLAGIFLLAVIGKAVLQIQIRWLRSDARKIPFVNGYESNLRLHNRFMKLRQEGKIPFEALGQINALFEHADIFFDQKATRFATDTLEKIGRLLDRYESSEASPSQQHTPPSPAPDNRDIEHLRDYTLAFQRIVVNPGTDLPVARRELVSRLSMLTEELEHLQQSDWNQAAAEHVALTINETLEVAETSGADAELVQLLRDVETLTWRIVDRKKTVQSGFWQGMWERWVERSRISKNRTRNGIKPRITATRLQEAA